MTNIGITGHRKLPDVDLCGPQVDAVLREIMSNFNGPYSLYSSLAEGADRLAVRRARDLLGARLVVTLPLKLGEFLADFPADSQLEFLGLLALADQAIEMPAGLSRPEAYESAGRFILDHVDVLIALWNGEPAKGRGGTGQMVDEARTRGLPVAWIHAGACLPRTSDSASLGPESLLVTYERFVRAGRELE